MTPQGLDADATTFKASTFSQMKEHETTLQCLPDRGHGGLAPPGAHLALHNIGEFSRLKVATQTLQYP
jgi:hypothetical protein